MTPSFDELRAIARERTKLHARHASQRLLSGLDHDFIGLCGEKAFADEFGLEMDLRVRPSGDRGVDFRLSIGTVDVKTYVKAYNLPREDGKPHANIIVLARFIPDAGRAILIGWEYDVDMTIWPVRTLPGQSVRNHLKPACALRKIDELKRLLVHPKESTN